MAGEVEAELEAADREVEAGAAAPSTNPAYTSAARLAVADSLRRLGHALVAHQPDDAVLEQLNAQVEAVLPALLAAPERPHAFLTAEAPTFRFPLPTGEGPTTETRNSFPDCVISGRANPMGLEAHLWREGDEAVGQVTLGAAYEGAPGRAHGGIVAAMIDETMGLVLSISATLAFTGRLTITYRAPTPLGVLLESRARLKERNGRKLTITGELKAGDQLLAQAEGLFIAVNAGHFLGEDAPSTG